MSENNPELIMKTNGKNIFTEHPNSVNMTYLQHLRFALFLFRSLFLSSLASLVHSVFPFLFITYTSNKISELYRIFQERLHKEL